MTNATLQKNSLKESADDVLDGLPCGVVSTLPDGTILHVNETFLAWTGQSREALLAGQRFQGLLTVPGRIFYETHFAPLLRMQGFVNEINCQIKREGRDPLQVLINSNLKLDRNGEPSVIRTVIFDATDRVRYEAELRHARSSAQHLAAIVTSSSDAIVGISFDDVVRSWNPGATSLFGYSEEEAVGRTVDELIVPEDMRDVRLQNLKKLSAGETVRFKDTLRRHKDGSLAQVEIIASPMRDNEGRVTAASLIFRDISERKRAEEALRQSEAFSWAVFESSPDCVKIIDSVGNLQRMNLNGQRCMEIDDFGTMCGLQWSELWPVESRSMIETALAEALAGRIGRFSGFCPTAKGAPRWWDVMVTAIPGDDGGPKRLVASSRDVTERKRAEERLEENEGKLRLGLRVAGTGLGVMDYVSGSIVLDEVAAGFFALPINRPLPRSEIHARFHPEDAPSVLAKIADALNPAGDGVLACEHRILRPNGSVIWISARKQVVFSTAPDGSKRATTGLLAVLDITARRLAEAEIAEREERLRLIIDGTLAFIGVMDADGTLVEANSPALVAGGVTRSDVIGRKVWETYWFNYDENVVEQMQAAVARALNGETVREDFVVRMRDDARMTIDFMLSPILDDRGSVRLLVPSGFDITERKSAEIALRDNYHTYLRLIENNPFGVYIVDADFRIAQVSAGARKVFGDIDPLLGRDLSEVIRILWPEPFASEVISRFRHTMETGESYRSKDMTEKRADRDSEESYDWQIERVKIPGGGSGVACYFYDITERKRYEHKIEMLMGEVNHRAKNLLTVVEAIARQTARTGDPSTFAILLSERIRGLAASQDLLVKNQWTSVGIFELVQAQLAHFNDMFGTRVLIEGPPVHLSASAAQGIGMALHELATNAVKYGALSNASGRIRICWETGFGGESLFVMHWLEEGGPEVVAPTRKGFGKRVIERMAEEAVSGSVDIEYRPSGLHWKLTTPSANLLGTMQHDR